MKANERVAPAVNVIMYASSETAISTILDEFIRVKYRHFILLLSRNRLISCLYPTWIAPDLDEKPAEDMATALVSRSTATTV